MDKREKAIAELKALIRQQRDRIDPRILDMAERAATGQSPQERKGSVAAKTVPYDTQAARKAIELFLKDHKDAPGFQKRLMEFLRKSDH